jgi:hypothetical protein
MRESLYSILLRLSLYLLLFTIISCSVNRTLHRPIADFILIESQQVILPIDTALYHPIDRTFFTQCRDENIIRIYQNGELMNTIGRSGFAQDNFRSLSDICLGSDGFLYTVDSFERVVKRFDRSGKYLTQVNLPSISSPTRISFAAYNFVFIYDSHSREIYALDVFDFSVKFTFGKFHIENVDKFFVNSDELFVYDAKNDQTHIFFVNGMFIETTNGFRFYRGEIAGDVISKQNFLNIERGLYITRSENTIKVYRASHE